ncbi:MAG: DUF4105 domain-containing protein [Deltaproteobacteria bacterium]|nr:DUF4105 domain-containing protein [Deltaproteobacteria bacterium]
MRSTVRTLPRPLRLAALALCLLGAARGWAETAGRESPAEAARWHPSQQRTYVVSGGPGGTLRLGNVRWGFRPLADGRREAIFREAEFSERALGDVYFVLEGKGPFGLAAHAQLYFEFAPTAPVRAGREASPGLVLSVDARLPKGGRFTLFDGVFRRSYGLVYQLTSWQDAEQQAERHHGRLTRHRLRLTPAQKHGLLREAVAGAVADRSGERFSTLTNNCYSNQLALLNRVLPEAQQLRRSVLGGLLPSPLAWLPPAAPVLLGLKGLLERD